MDEKNGRLYSVTHNPHDLDFPINFEELEARSSYEHSSYSTYTNAGYKLPFQFTNFLTEKGITRSLYTYLKKKNSAFARFTKYGRMEKLYLQALSDLPNAEFNTILYGFDLRKAWKISNNNVIFKILDLVESLANFNPRCFRAIKILKSIADKAEEMNRSVLNHEAEFKSIRPQLNLWAGLIKIHAEERNASHIVIKAIDYTPNSARIEKFNNSIFDDVGGIVKQPLFSGYYRWLHVPREKVEQVLTPEQVGLDFGCCCCEVEFWDVNNPSSPIATIKPVTA